MMMHDVSSVCALSGWIAGLRIRLDRGDFAAHPPVDIGYGTGALSADLVIRIMLADLDDLSACGDSANYAGERRVLLADFRQLRKLIG